MCMTTVLVESATGIHPQYYRYSSTHHICDEVVECLRLLCPSETIAVAVHPVGKLASLRLNLLRWATAAVALSVIHWNQYLNASSYQVLLAISTGDQSGGRSRADDSP